ncbi:MAG TPA: protein kinase, partial [Bryobacteraceae bacterium]|nr:protein kinase [Bryobacteraceae bacterium]
GNIKIKPDGTVKVLDFGLAKVNAGTSASGENSPTLTMGMTQAGMILGTAAYMAPEQARGKENVDKRADIWAFGVVLYELITGKRLFQGEDVGDTLASVIKEQPNLDDVPLQVRPLLKRCLEKDPKKRLRDIGDMDLLLSRDSDGAVEPIASTAPLQSRLGRAVPWAVAGVITLALAALAFVHFRETPPPEQTVRSSIALPENSTVHSFAISPDGRTLVIAAAVNGKRQLWLRPMDALQAQPMAFTEDATYPFWSPDSRFIGFFAQGKLKKVAASGGPAQSLCDVANGRGGSWNRDDVIVFSPGFFGISIQRVPAAGGVPVDVTKTKGTLAHPVFLPDGRHFLYVRVLGAAEQNGIYAGSLDGKEDRRVLPDGSSAVFASPAHGGRNGHILFVRENTLMAAPFDATSAQVSGDVFPVAEGVSLTNIVYLPVTVSEGGVLLYQTGGFNGGTNQIGWYDRSGKSLGPVGAPGNVLDPALSPDEKSVVFSRVAGGAETDLWVRDLSRGTETRFTTNASRNVAPVWSPQGDRIVFSSNRKGEVFNLYRKDASGSGEDELLLPNNRPDGPHQWSPDGRFIVYVEIDPKTKYDLWVLPVEGAAAPDGKAERKPIPFLRTEFDELFGQLSPDSHWMAYTSDRSGRREVYVRPFPPGEGEWTISIAGGEEPRWRGDGKELFFEAADGKMMAVPVKAIAGTRLSFEAGTPVALFDAHMVHSPTNNLMQYDVTADGKRFLIDTTGSSGAASPPLTVVTNWNAGLKK